MISSSLVRITYPFVPPRRIISIGNNKIGAKRGFILLGVSYHLRMPSTRNNEFAPFSSIAVRDVLYTNFSASWSSLSVR